MSQLKAGVIGFGSLGLAARQAQSVALIDFVSTLLFDFARETSGSVATPALVETFADPQAHAHRATVSVTGNVAPVVRARLNHLVALPAGWDGYGAVPVDAAILRVVDEFLGRVRRRELRTPGIVATGTGSVQLEWRSGGQALDVELLPDGRADLLYEREGDDRDDFEWSGAMRELPQAELDRILVQF